MRLIDTHAHLSDEQLVDDFDDVIGRARQADVDAIILVGTQIASSRHCIELAARYKGLYASAGIHPNYGHQAAEQDWSVIENWAREKKIVALGESGLDRYWKDCPWDIQVDYFHRHWRLSAETELPVIIHMRSCEEEMLIELKAAADRNPLRGVMHSFTGTMETAKHCLDMGLYISFAGMLTYKNAEEIREVAKQIPDERLLIETDCPYLSPEPKRRQRPNEPALIVHTLTCLAGVRERDPESLARITTDNARRLFRIDGSLL